MYTSCTRHLYTHNIYIVVHMVQSNRVRYERVRIRESTCVPLIPEESSSRYIVPPTWHVPRPLIILRPARFKSAYSYIVHLQHCAIVGRSRSKHHTLCGRRAMYLSLTNVRHATRSTYGRVPPVFVIIRPHLSSL